MLPMGALHADEALRLANERIAGLRAEQRRFAPRPTARPNRASRLRELFASLRLAIGEVEVEAPTVRLSDYPYRA